MSNLEFIESIKIVTDKEKDILLKIQNEIEEKGINKENVLEITKKLSNTQLNRLKQLYIEQIKELNFGTEQYRNRIIKIKSRLEKLTKVN